MHRVQCNILKEIKKGDLFLLAVFLLLAAGIASAPLLRSCAEKGSDERSAERSIERIVEIRVDGELRETCPLSADRVIRVDTDYGSNEITIADGEAAVTRADCSNQVCVQTGSIRSPGQLIVCLPHHLSVEIAAGEGAVSDGSSENSGGAGSSENSGGAGASESSGGAGASETSGGAGSSEENGDSASDAYDAISR